MDPLHPFVPIQAPPPQPPGYNRVERVDRDPQGDPGPEWERGSEHEAEEDAEQPFEDDYDPDWADPAAAEPYGPDGSPHDGAATVDLSTDAEPGWDPRTHPDRRSRPRIDDDDAEAGAGPHIDISA